MSSPPGDEPVSREDDAFLAYLYARAEEEIIPAHPDYDPEAGLDRFLAQVGDSPAGNAFDPPAGPLAARVFRTIPSPRARRLRIRWPAGLTLARLRRLRQRTQAEDAEAARGIRIPVAGATSAGKTRFLYASLNSLLLTAAQARIPVSFPDQASQDHAGYGLDLIRSGQHAVKMPARISAGLPVALNIRLGEGRRSSLIHLFDSTGEHFSNVSSREPHVLEGSQGLVYVLDPFSINAVQDRLALDAPEAVKLAYAATGDPEIAYSELVSRLRDAGMPAAAQRLAVVISKADLLRRTGIPLPSESMAIGVWLEEMGLNNLVKSAQREFSEVRYFAVASQDVTTSLPDDPGVPLRWLLASHGVRLPAGTRNHPAQRKSAAHQATGPLDHQRGKYD